MKCIIFILLLMCVGCESKDDAIDGSDNTSETEVDGAQTALPDWSNGEEYDDKAQEATLITISNTQELVTLAASTHSVYGEEVALNYSGYIIRLSTDIDLDGVDIETIGTRERPFMGEFDGAYFTISNLRQVSYQNYQGLFGAIGYGAKLHSLNVEGFTIGDQYSKSEVGYGALAGFSGGIVSQCTVSSSTISAYDKVSLFVGEDSGEVIDCRDGGDNIINIIE
ncbi:MAG: hypothetical protein SNG27_07515 [Rikenellaceae bacterium]